MTIRKTILAAALAAAALPAAAFEGSAGLGVHAFDFGYRGVDADVLPVPAMMLESEHFYFKGFEAGAYLWKTDRQRVTAGLSYMPARFDPDESDDSRMKQLDKRDAGMFFNLGYSLDTGYGRLNVKLAADVLGDSDGFMGDLSFLRRFDFGTVGVTPQIGLLWTSEKFNDYYYGISQAESRKSGLAAYSADGGVSPYFRLIADWRVTKHVSLYAEGSLQVLSEGIRDSGMVEDDVRTGIGCGVTYHF